MFIAILFLLKKMMSIKINVADYITYKNVIYFIILLFLQILVVFFLCIPWKLIIQIISSTKINFRLILRIHTETNILKYVPGNVFQYIGKGKICEFVDVKITKVYLATIVDFIINIIASILISAIFSFQNFKFYIVEYKHIYLMLLIIGSISLIAVYLILKRKKTLINIFKYLQIIENIHKYILCLLCYIILIIFNSCLYLAIIILIFRTPINFTTGLNIIGIFTFAWIIGFITPGVSGGIGIRESMMIIVAGQVLPESVIITSMILFRILSIGADFFAYILIACMRKINFIRNIYVEKKVKEYG